MYSEQDVLQLYNVYINDDPEFTLTYFTTMSNLAKLVFALGPNEPHREKTGFLHM